MALAPHFSSVTSSDLELAHQQVDDVVLLVALEHDVARLRMGLELGVEDLLLDDLVDGQLALDRGEQLGPGLDPTLGRRLELGEKLLDLVVVGLEQGDGIQGGLLQGMAGLDSATVVGAATRSTRGRPAKPCKRLPDETYAIRAMDTTPRRRRFPFVLGVGLAIAAGILVALAIDVGRAGGPASWLARHHLAAPYLAAGERIDIGPDRSTSIAAAAARRP